MTTNLRRGSARPRRKLRPVDWVVFLAALAVVAWLLIPGVGPNVLGLGGDGRDQQILTNAALVEDLEGIEVLESYDGAIPGYQRSLFGSGWADLDGDGCNTRNEILARDLGRPTFQPGTNDCVVQTGALAEPYTGTVVNFVRGQGTSALVQIDHVVALADAWRAGAWEWDSQTRLEFANDPLNLLAVDGDANYEKGASTADEWLPMNEDFHCDYVARQVAVKVRWQLAATADEVETFRQVLRTCSDVSLPN